MLDSVLGTRASAVNRRPQCLPPWSSRNGRGAGTQAEPAVCERAGEKAGHRGSVFKWGGQGSPRREGDILTKEVEQLQSP